MTIPGYDAWRMQGPPEYDTPEMTECDQCAGTGHHLRDEHDTGTKCHICGGSGEVPVEREEPDADWLYERARDDRMERDE